MGFKNVVVECRENVCIISINRPDVLNALNIETARELVDAFDEAEKSENVKVVVLRGVGRAFCSGGDLKSLKMEDGSINVEKFLDIAKEASKLILKIQNLKKPVIAAVDGYAVGAGFNLALACDLIIAGENARFGEVFLNVGFHPDTGGTYFLTHTVGPYKAKELFFTRRIIDACEAEKLGLVNKVVPSEKLEEEAVNLAKTLASGPCKAIELTKRTINKALNLDLASTIQLELEACNITTKTEDLKEGIQAMLEKRKPVFTGK
ncbi:MAG: enoyl-CoA hydratase/isomerase family protein [Candidatus Bathyarchaeota archaeon]